MQWKKFYVGSDGFVCLVDVMGNDGAIVQAARVSYGNELRSTDPELMTADAKLIRYLMRHRHCYAPHMEVLTAQGWKRWSDCNKTEEFLVPDPVDHRLRIEKLEVKQFFYSGHMYCFKNDRMNYSVTPEHKMWFKTKSSKKYEKVTAWQQKQWGHYEPLTEYSRVGNEDLPDSDYQLIGFYLGDGCLEDKNVIFRLKKKRKMDFLESLLADLTIEYTKEQCSDGAWKYKFHKENINKIDLKLKAKDKKFDTSYIPELSDSQINGLLSGLFESDGSIKHDRDQIEFSSTSINLAKLVCTLCAYKGIDAHFVKMMIDGIYAVNCYFGKRTTLETRAQYYYKDNFSGDVYCATSSTGLLMVRGGGTSFAFVCGNSTPFEMAELKFLVRVPMDTWRQWIRHRTACLSGDTRLQFDLPNGIDRKGNQLHTITIKDVFERFQPSENKIRPDKQGNPYFKRDRVQGMLLRCIDDSTLEFKHTHIVDIWETGIKKTYNVLTESGIVVSMSEDHLIRFEDGWFRLKDKIDLNHLGFGIYPKIATLNTICQKVKPKLNEPDSSEQWKPLIDWELYYEISTQGRIRRLGCFPKKITITNNRAVVSLNRPGFQVTVQIHHQMCRTFYGEPTETEECCHEDGNSLNNLLDNLRWDTQKANIDEKIKHNANTVLNCNFEKIIAVTFCKEEMTYDLETEEHNFSANGMIVHNSVNEYSTRYSEAIDSREVASVWRAQSTGNKQGSSGVVDAWPEGYGTRKLEYGPWTVVINGSDYLTRTWDREPTPSEWLSHVESLHHKYSSDVYKERLLFGMAREQARKDLPLSTYTEAYWKIDLHNLLHFLGLRMDSHAQQEIREYANVIGNIVASLFPVTWQAFLDYRLNAVTLSGPEIACLNGVFTLEGREKDEFLVKLKRLSISVP